MEFSPLDCISLFFSCWRTAVSLVQGLFLKGVRVLFKYLLIPFQMSKERLY